MCILKVFTVSWVTLGNSYLSYSYPSFVQMLSSKDINFVGYTYKNFKVVNDCQVPGMGTFFISASLYACPINHAPLITSEKYQA